MGQLCLSDFMASTAVFNGALSASPSFVLMGALSARSCEIITQLCLMGGYVCLMAPAVFNGALSATHTRSNITSEKINHHTAVVF